MTRLALIGGGGHASDLLGVIEEMDPRGELFEVSVGDDEWRRKERFRGRRARLVSIEESLMHADRYIGAAGYPSLRRSFVARAQAGRVKPAEPLVHPTAILGSGLALGEGTVVQGLSWLSPMVHVGQHCYVGYGAKLGHDVAIGSFASLMPGCIIGGEVKIGEGAMVGAGAVVLQGLSIGERAVVGAGSTVVADVGPDATVVGSPARPVSSGRGSGA